LEKNGASLKVLMEAMQRKDRKGFVAKYITPDIESGYIAMRCLYSIVFKEATYNRKYYNKKCYHILINRYLSVVNEHIQLSSLPPTGLTTCQLERLFFTNVIILSSIKDKIIIFAAKNR